MARGWMAASDTDTVSVTVIQETVTVERED